MPAPDAHAATEGSRLLGGRYRLGRYIAKGGMAEVWEGHDEVLSRPVAVKVLLSHLASDSTVLERFRREAVTAARLAHPGVVATYDTGVDGDTAWIVMELVPGRTLRGLISEKGKLEPALAVSIAGQITDALAHAHRAGLVHRDIKPANVLLCEDEGTFPRAKVTDFGIAKATEGLGLDLTRTGIVLGTPKYLSPEQVEGIEPDARADLYALGVVLFEMLTGRPPFSGTTDMATALSHLRDSPPRVGQLRPELPADLDDIVAELLVKDRDERTPSATALRRELAGAARHLGAGPSRLRPDVPTPSQPTTVIAGGVGGGASAAASAWTRARNGTPPDGSARGSGDPGVVAARGSGDPGVVAATRPAAPTWGVASPPTRTRASVPPPPTRVDPAQSPTGADTGWSEGVVAGASGAGAEGRRRRRRGPGILVAVLVVAGIVIAAVLFGQAGNGGGLRARLSSGPLAISTASEYGLPSGHSPDNPGQLSNLYDGNPATGWSTDHYNTSAFGGYYPGLGVVLELNGTHALRQMTIMSPSQGWSAEAYVANRKPGGTSVTSWGKPLGHVSSSSGTATLSLDGRAGRYVMLWINDLGPAHQIKIDEVTIR